MNRLARRQVDGRPNSVEKTSSTACFCAMRTTPCVGSAAAELHDVRQPARLFDGCGRVLRPLHLAVSGFLVSPAVE